MQSNERIWHPKTIWYESHYSDYVGFQKQVDHWRHYGSRRRDLLPNHGWFPKFFQNIFILKSHKRMFSETKVKRKERFLFENIQHCSGNKILPQKRHSQSNTAKQSGYFLYIYSRCILTCHNCTGRSSNRCCSWLWGYRLYVMMFDREPMINNTWSDCSLDMWQWDKFIHGSV